MALPKLNLNNMKDSFTAIRSFVNKDKKAANDGKFERVRSNKAPQDEKKRDSAVNNIHDHTSGTLNKAQAALDNNASNEALATKVATETKTNPMIPLFNGMTNSLRGMTTILKNILSELRNQTRILKKGFSEIGACARLQYYTRFTRF